MVAPLNQTIGLWVISHYGYIMGIIPLYEFSRNTFGFTTPIKDNSLCNAEPVKLLINEPYN